MSYAKFEISEEVKKDIAEALKLSQDTGKIKKGTNEVTKAVERGNAKLVLIGKDVEPPEIVMHLPMLCEEKKLPYAYLTKEEIGDLAGIPVPCAATCVLEEGKAKDLIKKIVKSLEEAKAK